MIKVLQIIDGNKYGGICKLFLDMEKYLSHDIKFEYLTAVKICDDWHNLDVDRHTIKGRIIFNRRLEKFLKKNSYDIVHINSGAFFFTFFATLACKKAKVKKIVVHSHNSPKINIFKRIIIRLLNPLYRNITDAHLSCSSNATKSLFTKSNDVIILKNGIIVEDYKYNSKIRQEYIKSLGITNKKVYAHIGGFTYQKNHNFVIDLFNELSKYEDAVLLLIGTGELEDSIKSKINDLNIGDKVYFLGFRNDVNKILNCIDCLLFPSFYEGLSLTLIEAQTNGVMVFASSNIFYETKISPFYNSIDGYDISNWMNIIHNTKVLKREYAYKYTIKNGYDIISSVRKLEKIYRDLMK